MKGVVLLQVQMEVIPSEDELLDAGAAWIDSGGGGASDMDDGWAISWIAARRLNAHPHMEAVVVGNQVEHEHDYQFARYCGAYVCTVGDCNHHRGLARCYCGWADDGGDGRRQLLEMGEVIEPEDYY